MPGKGQRQEEPGVRDVTVRLPQTGPPHRDPHVGDKLVAHPCLTSKPNQQAPWHGQDMLAPAPCPCLRFQEEGNISALCWVSQLTPQLQGPTKGHPKQLRGYQHPMPAPGTAAVPLVTAAEPMQETKRTKASNTVPAPSWVAHTKRGTSATEGHLCHTHSCQGQKGGSPRTPCNGCKDFSLQETVVGR